MWDACAERKASFVGGVMAESWLGAWWYGSGWSVMGKCSTGGIAAPSAQVFDDGGRNASGDGRCSCPDVETVGVESTQQWLRCCR